MSDELEPRTDPARPVIYQIRLKSYLDSEWTDWFQGLVITLEEGGDTLLTGQVVDQAALHGLLRKVRDLGMPLVSVACVEPDQSQGEWSKSETHPHPSDEEIEMNAAGNTTEIKDRKMRLSALWIFATLNYIYADVFTLFFVPGAQKTTAAMSAGAALAFAILIETAIAMVLLSRLLKYRANRRVNILVGVIQSASVVSTLFTATPAPFYVLFAAIEIACTLVIVWYAWTWPNAEA